MNGLFEIPDDPGFIGLDSGRGKELGFTSDKFSVASYLWEKEDSIYISFIESIEKGKGYLSELFNSILASGKIIKVPTPLPNMEAILKAKGFKHTFEKDKDCGETFEVWLKGEGDEEPHTHT